MNASKFIRVACVGAGYFSRFHYESWARMDMVQQVGACDLDLGRARATGLAAYEKIDTMLAETRPDILDIVLPPTAQAETLTRAFAAAAPVVICQKPFCRNLDEARQMVQLAKDADVTLIVHENFRFQPWYRAIKSALDARSIGEVHQITFRLRPGDGQGPDAYLDRQPYFRDMQRFLIHETAVHWIDTFRYLLGEPTAVYADLRQMNPAISGEDAGYVLFDFDGGARGLFDGNRHLDHSSDNLRRTMGEALVEGTGGTISLLGDGSVHLRAFGSQKDSILLPPDSWSGFGGDCVHGLQSHVVSSLLNGTALENTAIEYLQVLEIEEALYASASTRQKVTLGRP